MPYEKRISRAQPGCVVVVLDDSGSMGDPLPGTSDPKYQWVERLLGFVLKELLARSTETKGDAVVIKPRYFATVITYGSTPHLWGSEGMDIQAVVEKYTREGNSLGLGGKLGGTDAAAALQMVLNYLQGAVAEQQFSSAFPPTVFHLTDGMSATDARPVVEQIARLDTSDGNVLLVNAFIGTETNLAYKGPEDFPGYAQASEVGPSDDNLRLFEMSSEIPEVMRANLVQDGIFPNLRAGARLFFDVRTREMLKHTLAVVGSIGSRADRMAR
ncbi:MAG: VWA domain-containing protein [Planctomycetes bacterium]|nr:VWA domain-containing protein [Planctomycetota bacterium]